MEHAVKQLVVKFLSELSSADTINTHEKYVLKFLNKYILTIEDKYLYRTLLVLDINKRDFDQLLVLNREIILIRTLIHIYNNLSEKNQNIVWEYITVLQFLIDKKKN